MGDSNSPFAAARKSAKTDGDVEPHNCAEQGEHIDEGGESGWKCARCQLTYASREVAARIDLDK